jgi:hypothetical protein
MKKLICILTVLFILTGCSSYQHLFWLNKDRKQITRDFDPKKSILTATGPTLIFQVDSPQFSHTKWTFHFDRNGKCDWIVMTFNCEKCYLLALAPIITSNSCRWAQLDSLTYVSDYKFKVELHKRYQNNPYSFILKRMGNWPINGGVPHTAKKIRTSFHGNYQSPYLNDGY